MIDDVLRTTTPPTVIILLDSRPPRVVVSSRPNRFSEVGVENLRVPWPIQQCVIVRHSATLWFCTPRHDDMIPDNPLSNETKPPTESSLGGEGCCILEGQVGNPSPPAIIIYKVPHCFGRSASERIVLVGHAYRGDSVYEARSSKSPTRNRSRLPILRAGRFPREAALRVAASVMPIIEAASSTETSLSGLRRRESLSSDRTMAASHGFRCSSKRVRSARYWSIPCRI